jgi:hypothetical protein
MGTGRAGKTLAPDNDSTVGISGLFEGVGGPPLPTRNDTPRASEAVSSAHTKKATGTMADIEGTAAYPGGGLLFYA